MLAILKPILRDEMILSRMKKPEEPDGQNQEKLTDNEQLINMVNKAVTSIVNRLNSLAHFDGLDSKVIFFWEKVSFSGVFTGFFCRLGRWLRRPTATIICAGWIPPGTRGFKFLASFDLFLYWVFF